MNNLETLLQNLEKPSPKNGKFSIFETAQILQLIEIIRVQKEALESALNKSAHIKSKYGHEINRKIADARAKVQEIAGRK